MNAASFKFLNTHTYLEAWSGTYLLLQQSGGGNRKTTCELKVSMSYRDPGSSGNGSMVTGTFYTRLGTWLQIPKMHIIAVQQHKSATLESLQEAGFRGSQQENIQKGLAPGPRSRKPD